MGRNPRSELGNGVERRETDEAEAGCQSIGIRPMLTSLRKKDNSSQGKWRINSRTRIAWRDDVIRRTIYIYISNIDQQFILKAFVKNCFDLATDTYGCRVIYQCFDNIINLFVKLWNEKRVSTSTSGTSSTGTSSKPCGKVQ